MKKIAIVTASVVFLLIVVGLVLFWSIEPDPEPELEPVPEEEVTLYYLNEREHNLEAVQKKLPETESRARRVHQIVDELKSSPDEAELSTLLPEDLELYSVFFEGQTVYLDFNDALIGAAEGTTGEFLFLHSIVNSVIDNLPEEQKLVQFLVDGEMRKTIGPYGEESGHIGVKYPLGPEWDIVE